MLNGEDAHEKQQCQKVRRRHLIMSQCVSALWRQQKPTPLSKPLRIFGIRQLQVDWLEAESTQSRVSWQRISYENEGASPICQANDGRVTFLLVGCWLGSLIGPLVLFDAKFVGTYNACVALVFSPLVRAGSGRNPKSSNQL